MDMMTSSLPCNEDADIPICPKCGKPLKFRLTVGKYAGKLVDCTCDCDTQKEQASRDAAKKEQDAKEIQFLRSKAFVSSGYYKKTFANSDHRYGAKQEELALRFARYTVNHRDSKYGLLMCGSPAGGKTYHSACIANILVDNKRSVIMRSMPSIIHGYSFKDDSMFKDFESCDLLIIDDLGTERDTAFGQELTYTAINTRYEAEKPLVVSTNLTLEQLSKPTTVMEQRIYGRILEMCYPVVYETGRARVTSSMYDNFKRDIGIGG